MSSKLNKKNKTKKAKNKMNTIVNPPIIPESEFTLATLHDSIRMMQQYMVSKFDNLESKVTGLERTVTGMKKDVKRIDDYLKVDAKML